MKPPDPLAVALGNQRKPLPASNAEACRELLERQRRRVTAADHQRFRETLADPHRDDSDITELLVELRNNREGVMS